MLSLLRQRKYRIILAANFISLFGSGLSHAGMIWYVLERTRSESAVALLVAVITVPSLFFLPFTGLLIDRVDRRHLAMVLDVGRGAVVAALAASAWSGHLRLWQLYAMGVLLGIGVFIYWPTLSALIQEMVEGRETVQVNALLMGAAQGGWMIAGTLVGLLYGSYGLAGVLTVDALSYAVSAFLYFRLRRGKNLAYRKQHEGETVGSFAHELAGGLRYTLGHKPVLIVGTTAALFQAAMMSQNVLTAPLNDKLLRSGAVGFGLCNAGWSLGAILASGAAGSAFRGETRAVQALWLALSLTGAACLVLPFSQVLAVAVLLYFLMGGGRGLAGVAIGTAMMQEVPRHVMGRTQNLFTCAGILLQLLMTFGVGWLAEHVHLATGFLLVGGAYLAGSALSYNIRTHTFPIPEPEPETIIVTHEEG